MTVLEAWRARALDVDRETARRKGRTLTPEEEARIKAVLAAIPVLEHTVQSTQPPEIVPRWTEDDGRQLDALIRGVSRLPADRQLGWAQALREVSAIFDLSARSPTLDGALHAVLGSIERVDGRRNELILEHAKTIRARHPYSQTHSTRWLALEVHDNIKRDYGDLDAEAVRKLLRTNKVR